MADANTRKTLRMTVLDIPCAGPGMGVGLAVLIETPGGRTWLYDSGVGYPEGAGWKGNHNSGRDLIAPLLRRRGLRELDGVIISHAHYDHFGGLLWLVEHVPIARLVDPGYDFEGPVDAHYGRELADYLQVRERFSSMPGAYQAVTAGDAIALDDLVRAEVLAPSAGFFREPGVEDRADNPAAHFMLNRNSLVLRVKHGRVVFLLGGDIEKDDQERFLLPSLPPGRLRCDVLIAPGHGLHTHPAFAAAARPKVAVASLFKEWMASCSACEAYAAYGTKVYVTGRDGDVEMVCDGDGFTHRAGRER